MIQNRMFVWIACALLAGPLSAMEPIHTDKGMVTGTLSGDSKIRIYRGIPYAAPPVGYLRWKAPQEAAPWKKVLKADAFGPRPMQWRIYDDMVFRDKGPSENCLTLNVWTPAAAGEKLPVMVWIYGGGFVAGGTSEPRQDGEHLAAKGVVVVSMNYRLGVFGFLSHPELSKESGGPSGNYGLLDQLAALKWVQKNIAAFGGDAGQVCIFGESAGSFSVSAMMASPLAKGLFQRAIGESGSLFGSLLRQRSLTQSEETGLELAKDAGADSLKALRAKSADALLKIAAKGNPYRFSPAIDGVFLPDKVEAIYASGSQSHVPLLAGWNRDEGNYKAGFQGDEPTLKNYEKRARAFFGDKADEYLKLYHATNDEEAKRAAQDLAGDQFIGHGAWKWLEAHAATGKSPIYCYRFDQPLPGSSNANHSAEIESVFGTQASKKVPWTDVDAKLSDQMMDYWSNFAKKDDPNGAGLLLWPVYDAKTKYKVMHLSADSHVAVDAHRKRHLFLDTLPR